MKDAAVKLRGEARRTASILHQTPGWRWRRELCLTERSQQCQSGPTTKAWRRLPARQRQTRVRHRQSTCEEQCQNWRETLAGEHRPGHVRGALPELHGNGWRVRVAPPGACGLHRQNEIHAGVDSIVSKNLADNGVATPRDMRAALEARRLLRQRQCGWLRQTASSGRVRVAPPGSDTWTSAESTIEAGPSYRSCTASPQRRRCVTVPSLIETTCEL